MIRPFREEDYARILDIYGRSKLDELKFEPNQFELLPLEQDPVRLGELKESDIYVYQQEQITAYGALYGAEIRALFVDPDARGQGIGIEMLEFLLAKINGTASLYVAKTNLPAKTLYERYHFSVTEEFETSYNGRRVIANKMVRLADVQCA